MSALSSTEFELVEQLHDGRQTRVFRARRVADGRAVVLKVLSEEGAPASAIPQYRREYEITRSLDGIDGVIRFLDLLDVQGALMIVEEDIGGASLDRELKRSRPGLSRLLALAIRIAHVLEQIHRCGIVHKDINPANIVWNSDSDELRIIDFGIASKLGQEHQEFLSPAQMEGTLAYTSPEQTGRINRAVDARSDLYSFGVTLYELFTGVLPFPAREGIEQVHSHIAVAPTPPERVTPAVPPGLSRIIMRLLEKMADDRYQSASGAEHDLRRCHEQLLATGTIVPFKLGEADVPIRFHLPQRLYGRDAEVASILAAFDRVAAGAAELLLVAGSPGVGKSVLVHEVHKPLTARRGNFVSGKFDQYQRDVPFHAWTQAFQELCNQLLCEDETSLARWRGRILAAVGQLGRVLTSVVPSIELIIGEQPDVPPLSGEQALNRLGYVFGNFINAMGVAEHPLVVFIDDWQWADSGSLALLRSVMGSGESDHLLVIGAYRDGEVDEDHPFARCMDELRRGGIEVGLLHVANLREEDVHQLVVDALPGAEQLPELSRLIHDKTQGNAFFVVQLLTDLHDKGAISFDSDAVCWRWDRTLIEAARVADNVVDLMAGRIGGLPQSSRRAVIHAACIGDRFRLATLARVLGQAPHVVADDLERVLQEGMVAPVGSSYRLAAQESNTLPVVYQFVHDRVRQAAYGLPAPEVRTRAHYSIARLWVAEMSAEEQERNIFEIANQYNAARALVTSDEERGELLHINLRAGKRAKQSADYVTALNYVAVALDLRSERCWEEQREQTSALLLLACEVAFLSKDYAAMEAWLAEYLSHADTPLERVSGLRIRVQARVAQNQLSDAVAVALQALHLLGCTLPKAPGKMRVLGGLIQTRLALRRKPIPMLRELPEMTDPNRLARMDLLGLMLPPAYWTSPNLLALTVFRMVTETLEHGYSPNAGYGLSWWGITECALLGNIPSGAAFGEFAIELARERRLNLQQPLFFEGWIIHKTTHALRDTLPLLQQACAVALEKGDFEYASYARNNHAQMRLHCGTPLAELVPEMERAHRELVRYQVGSSQYWHDIWWQTVLNFVAAPEPVDVLAGRAYDEAESLPQHLRVSDHSTLFLLYTAKLMLALHFGQTEAAVAHARAARVSSPAGVGMHAHALFHFYESLALIADATHRGLTLDRDARSRLAGNQKLLAHAAKYAPMNYRHHWSLVEAERLRVDGKPEEAMRHYERAMELARDNRFVHEEALAHELAARFHFGLKREGLATYYLRQALHLYERWGSAGKVARLRAEFPMRLVAVPGVGAGAGATHTTAHTTAHSSSRAGSSQGGGVFDVEAVVRASQAISGEIVIDRLVESLLKLVIEHSGAQKAVLILQHEAGLRIEATGVAGAGIVVRLDATPFDERDDLPVPRAMIQYVARTQRSVVIDDVRDETRFSADPYFLRNRPLSVLCEPILRQGVLAGMLYLENDLVAGAFTKGRMELLRVLSAQAAISLQNALLYGNLEQKVNERTRKLQESLQVQEQLNAELQASGDKLETALAQLREASYLLEERANTDGLTALANRRYFGERLEYELGRCAREQQPLALIMCDLDNFKRYNDLYGHVAGDECLRRTASTLKALFGRTTDLVARYGGEEFVVLLPATDAAEVIRMGERMRQAIAELAMPHSANESFGIVTLSVGCHAMVPALATSADSVIEAADRALYRAKNEGRNCLVSL